MSQPALPNLHEFDHDLDWADMNWSPEPVDAEPGKLLKSMKVKKLASDI